MLKSVPFFPLYRRVTDAWIEWTLPHLELSGDSRPGFPQIPFLRRFSPLPFLDLAQDKCKGGGDTSSFRPPLRFSPPRHNNPDTRMKLPIEEMPLSLHNLLIQQVDSVHLMLRSVKSVKTVHYMLLSCTWFNKQMKLIGHY